VNKKIMMKKCTTLITSSIREIGIQGHILP